MQARDARSIGTASSQQQSMNKIPSYHQQIAHPDTGASSGFRKIEIQVLKAVMRWLAHGRCRLLGPAMSGTTPSPASMAPARLGISDAPATLIVSGCLELQQAYLPLPSYPCSSASIK